MTRLEFMAQELEERTLIKHPVTKQDLIEHGVIQEEVPAICMRDARPDDRAAIRDLTLAAYQEYAEPLGVHWEGYRDGMLQALENLGKDNLSKSAQQIVVDNNGEIVATILLYPAGTMSTAPNGKQLITKPSEMRLLAVSPEKRRLGLATLLMRECIERVKASGAKTVMFRTTALMKAERLYQRVGNFIRAPEFDFHLEPESLESYRLDLQRK